MANIILRYAILKKYYKRKWKELENERMKITFAVKGEPKGKERPRFVNNGQRLSVYTPEKTQAYETQIKFAYYEQCGNVKFTEESQLELFVKAYYKIPKNTSKKKKQTMLSGEIRPTKKPDGDNILKAVADALNGVCYKDDKCLIKMSIEKFYSDMPRIEVVVQKVITDENDSSEMMRE
jgi:Holliday junction resolvase RusA-like endonuclease